MYGRFKGRHILSVSDFNREDLEFLIDKAGVAAARLKEDEHSLKELLRYKRLFMIFYEPSTRTWHSFEAAGDLTGMWVGGIKDPASSSAAKGETLTDAENTIRGYFADVFVIRHKNEGAVRRASEHAFYPSNHRLEGQSIPVINAGDGANQHPTQTLTDLTSVYFHHKKIDGLVYLFNNDLKNGRTVHSFAEALLLFRPKKVYFCSSSELPMPPHILEEYARHGVDYEEVDRYEDVLPEADVVYDTRPQLEREKMSDSLKAKIRQIYTIRAGPVRQLAKKDMILMHPLPRDSSFMSPEEACDKLPQAKYFEGHAHVGPPARVALLCAVQGVRL